MPDTEAPPEATVSTYRARRRLKLAPGTFREPGELYPEAHRLRLIDAHLHTGYVVPALVTESEFRAAVTEHIADPDEQTRLLHMVLGEPRDRDVAVAVVPEDKPVDSRTPGLTTLPVPPPLTRVPRKVGTKPVKAVGSAPKEKLHPAPPDTATPELIPLRTLDE